MAASSHERASGRRERLARPTSAEAALATALRARGLSYRREARIGGGYADFWFPRERVAVEIDGPQHRRAGWRVTRDVAKAAQLAERGIVTVRLTNAEVLASPAAAATYIAHVLSAHALSATNARDVQHVRRPRRRTRTRRARAY